MKTPPYPEDSALFDIPVPPGQEGMWAEEGLQVGVEGPDTIFLLAHLQEEGKKKYGRMRALYLRLTDKGWVVRPRQVGEDLPAELVELLIAHVTQHQRDNPEPWAESRAVALARKEWKARYGTVRRVPRPLPTKALPGITLCLERIDSLAASFDAATGTTAERLTAMFETVVTDSRAGTHTPLLELSIFADGHWTTWPTAAIEQIVRDFSDDPSATIADPAVTLKAIHDAHNLQLTTAVENTGRPKTFTVYEPRVTTNDDGTWDLRYETCPMTLS